MSHEQKKVEGVDNPSGSFRTPDPLQMARRVRSGNELIILPPDG